MSLHFSYTRLKVINLTINLENQDVLNTCAFFYKYTQHLREFEVLDQ